MKKNKYKAIIYIILSAFSFAFMFAFVRMAGELPTFQKVFFRNFIAMLIAVATLIKTKTPFKIEGKTNKWVIFVRAAAGTAGMLGNFYAIDKLALSDASMLNKMSPFFTIVFSYIFLKEKLTPFQLLTVIGAFIGAMFIIKPSFANAALFPSVLGFLGGMGAGLAYACVRYLGQHGVHGKVIVAYFSGFSCLVTLPYLLFLGKEMSISQILCLIGAGCAAAGGQFTITAAYTHAPAREISVYDYSQLIFTMLLGFFLFGDIPDVWSFVGYFIIVTMGVLVFLYNNVWHAEEKGEKQPG
ncbi:DMT family transporter [Ruminococcus sp. NK3A76]|uniref:DMT family transporter n=1 Tax=Ruminococcus sp. NK3A76 TaxID=877411 RepID=UPI00049018B4|nr:DMT family transporter [Ruminococcus sp. NK3A76]